ncbi:MAG: hypothetical protein ABGZ53_21890 [Fuerstiella sp.]
MNLDLRRSDKSAGFSRKSSGKPPTSTIYRRKNLQFGSVAGIVFALGEKQRESLPGLGASSRVLHMNLAAKRIVQITLTTLKESRCTATWHRIHRSA